MEIVSEEHAIAARKKTKHHIEKLLMKTEKSKSEAGEGEP